MSGITRRGRQQVTIPPLWDGQASGRIVDVLLRELKNGRQSGRWRDRGLPAGKVPCRPESQT